MPVSAISAQGGRSRRSRRPLRVNSGVWKSADHLRSTLISIPFHSQPPDMSSVLPRHRTRASEMSMWFATMPLSPAERAARLPKRVDHRQHSSCDAEGGLTKSRGRCVISCPTPTRPRQTSARAPTAGCSPSQGRCGCSSQTQRPPSQRAQNRIWPPVDLLAACRTEVFSRVATSVISPAIGKLAARRADAIKSDRLLAARDQPSMCFTVEIGHLPSCPLIAMRSPCSSSRKS
jgi:hypothetical protein